MTTEHDTDDLDFAMLTPPTRPGPCKAAAAPEIDPVMAKIIASNDRHALRDEARRVKEEKIAERMRLRSIEIRHGSGKVKV